MALRAAMTNNNLNKKLAMFLSKGNRSIVTRAGTIPKMKPYTSTVGEQGSVQGKHKPNYAYTPVYVSLGLITLAFALGVHTAKQQFMHSPGVRVKKSKRETVPEVVDPDHVANESDNFIKKSLFRKVAHVQEFQTPLDDPIHGNPLAKELRVESLKSVGLDPREVADLRR